MTNQSQERFKIYKNVFDEFTLQTLFKMSSQGHFEELISPIMIGKESNVFLAGSKEKDFVIVKIYRLASCNFNKMFSYIKSDPRFQNLQNKRRLVIFKWVQREYRNLMLAREVISVPQPIAFANNVLVMESIGENRPAQQLKDCPPQDPEKFSRAILESLRKLCMAGLVHGDISEFNILNYSQKPFFIDFSQSTSSDDVSAMEYLERDIGNIARFFRKQGLKIDPKLEFNAIRKEYEKKKSLYRD